MLEILVPILYHLNDARSDQSRLGLMHIGVFILLLLSGERNFGKIRQMSIDLMHNDVTSPDARKEFRS